MNLIRSFAVLRMTKEAGFTLTEILVTMAILSFGLMGIAAMQVVGVRANQGSYFRSQATFIASDMAERLYSNRVATRAFAYDGFDSSSVNCAGAAPSPLCSVDYVNTTAPAAVACTGAQMALYDRFFATCGYADGSNRLGGIRDLLPNGSLLVDCVNAAGATVVCAADSMRRIRVSWDERVKTSTTTATTTTQSSGQSLIETQTVSLTIQP
ncbi:MAG: type IV pilus modification protein PilV [Pseudomonadota bacterium]